jgi:hypothetical protein
VGLILTSSFPRAGWQLTRRLFHAGNHVFSSAQKIISGWGRPRAKVRSPPPPTNSVISLRETLFIKKSSLGAFNFVISSALSKPTRIIQNRNCVTPPNPDFLSRESNGRGGEIRTRDLLLPKQALYQAKLRPDDWLRPSGNGRSRHRIHQGVANKIFLAQPCEGRAIATPILSLIFQASLHPLLAQ